MEKLTIEMCNKYKSCENCPYRDGSCSNMFREGLYFDVDFMGTEEIIEIMNERMHKKIDKLAGDKLI